MATVKKISRSISYLPPIKTLADWFSYAFKSSELDEVYRFPTLSPSTEKEKEIGQAPSHVLTIPESTFFFTKLYFLAFPACF